MAEESVAETRPRRSNAGRNIGKLINQELDDFYKTAYGGFDEASEDEEYESEDSDADEIDSDFDVDESNWNVEDEQDEVIEKKKKKQWIKPYKPKSQEQSEVEPRPPKRKKAKITPFQPSQLLPQDTDSSDHRSLRRSTLEVSEEYRRRFEEEEDLRRRKMRYSSSRKPKPLRKLTQKEMFAEARRTEIENLASLEAYARLEAEKKKVKEKKTVVQGPFIRFHSIAMPLIEELPDNNNSSTKEPTKDVAGSVNNSSDPSVQIKQEPNVDGANPTETAPVANDNTTKEGEELKPAVPVAEKMYCRNFLIFTDTKNFPSAFFPTSKPQRPRKRFCPFTGLPAKYIDPLTGTPYATSQAFKIIRNRYVSEGEQRCEKRLMQLSSWLEEKKRKKLEARIY